MSPGTRTWIVAAVLVTFAAVALAAVDPPRAANAPALPWLRAWTGCLERGQVPHAARRGRLLTLGGLPGVPLSHNGAIVGGITAKRYRGGKELAAMVSVLLPPHDIVTAPLFYWKGARRSHRMFRSRAADLSSEWVELIDTSGPPRALLGKGNPGAKAGRYRSVVRLITLEAAAQDLRLLPLRKTAHETLNHRLWIEWNARTRRYSILDPLSGKVVADGPPRPNRHTAQEFRSVLRVAGELRTGGVEVTGEERDRCFRLAWYRRPARGSRWRRRTLPLTAGYCRPFLPPALRELALDPDRVDDIVLWKDGSLIFRFGASSRAAPEQIHFCGIARQPPHGKAQLLAWGVYHSYAPPSALQAQGVRGLRERRWSEDGSGRIRSQPSLECGWVNDFHFDTDFANGDVIFLLGDKLWAVRVGPGVVGRNAGP